MRYVIKCNYYHVNPNDPNDMDYTKPEFLGTEGKLGIFVWEDEVTERTKIFNNATEAGQYLDKHDALNGYRQRCWCSDVYIAELS